MKLFSLLVFVSVPLFGQTDHELQNQIKLKGYSHLDSINGYSGQYSTKLIEGSGFITGKKNKNIGSTGYSIQITKDKNDHMVRVLKSESIHYKKYDKNPQKVSSVRLRFTLINCTSLISQKTSQKHWSPIHW